MCLSTLCDIKYYNLQQKDETECKICTYSQPCIAIQNLSEEHQNIQYMAQTPDIHLKQHHYLCKNRENAMAKKCKYNLFPYYIPLSLSLSVS